jgi:DNA-binding response OmpR family regulator
VREGLKEHGVPGELIVISDGETAIRFIESFDEFDTRCPDLVILDLNLPKAPGLSVLRTMRRSMKCRDVAVVILSSSEVQNEKDAAAQFGADRFIRKPMLLEEFLSLGAVFRSLLEQRRGGF